MSTTPIQTSSWNPFKYPPQAVIKSIWGFLLPAIAIILKTLQDGKGLSWTDLLIALLTACVTGYGVFIVKNQPPGEVTVYEAQHRADSADMGVIRTRLLWSILGVVAIVISILGLLGVLALGMVTAIILAILGLVFLIVGFAG